MVQYFSFPPLLSWQEKNTEQGFSPITCSAAGIRNQTIQNSFGLYLIIPMTADWIQNVKGYLLGADNINYYTFLIITKTSSRFHRASTGKADTNPGLVLFSLGGVLMWWTVALQMAVIQLGANIQLMDWGFLKIPQTAETVVSLYPY